jgi:serine/threonine-protein kinase
VGSYRIVRLLGTGGTAQVFEVEHTTLGTRHALKVLLPHLVEVASIRSRFLNEGRLQAAFRHPGLVRVTDTIAEPGVAGLVMDFLHGESMWERMQREGAIAAPEAVGWVIAALDALQEAHEAGIIHRDIKPENLFLEKNPGSAKESVRVLDFGIAKGPDSTPHTVAGGTLGTLAYMSPEQIENPGEVDARTDLFSMGVVLWELLVGRPLFEAASDYLSMQQVVEGSIDPPSERRPGIPGWLDDIVMAALRRDPAHRFDSAKAFADALRAGARRVELPTGPDAAPSVRDVRSADARRFGMVLATVLFGLIGLGLVATLFVVGIGWMLRPAEVEGIYVISDACGKVTIDADVDAGGIRREVMVSVDGGLPAFYSASGRSTVVHTSQHTPGDSILVDVTIGNARDSVTHTVTGQPTRVSLQRPAERSEGRVGRTVVRVEGSCVPAGLTYEARVDSAVTTGPVPSSGTFQVDTTGLSAGRHRVDVRVLDASGQVLDDRGITLKVDAPGSGAAPTAEGTPGDEDGDGYTVAMGDCDDTDPDVNPGRSEARIANGVDDDCDGRVDEGTTAYDDDGDGLSEDQGDCNDAAADIRPGAVEVWDCRDQDCDGAVDEGTQPIEREDRYEPNDTQATAFDLGTRNQRQFTKQLDLVASSSLDEAWFTFYSQDGDFDSWGIDVRIDEMPVASVVEVEVFDASGASRGTQRLASETDLLTVRGRWLSDDSGTYTLRVKPETLYANWCPIGVVLESR